MLRPSPFTSCLVATNVATSYHCDNVDHRPRWCLPWHDVVPTPASSTGLRTRHRVLPRDAPHNRRCQCALLFSHSLELDQGTPYHFTTPIRDRKPDILLRPFNYRLGLMRARATRSTYWALILVQSSFSSWTPIRSRKSTAVRYHSPSRMSPYSTPLRVSFLVRTRYLTGLLSSSTAKSFALTVAPSYDTHRTGTPRLVPDSGVDVDGDPGFFLICVNRLHGRHSRPPERYLIYTQQFHRPMTKDE